MNVVICLSQAPGSFQGYTYMYWHFVSGGTVQQTQTLQRVNSIVNCIVAKLPEERCGFQAWEFGGSNGRKRQLCFPECEITALLWIHRSEATHSSGLCSSDLQGECIRADACREFLTHLKIYMDINTYALLILLKSIKRSWIWKNKKQTKNIALGLGRLFKVFHLVLFYIAQGLSMRSLLCILPQTLWLKAKSFCVCTQSTGLCSVGLSMPLVTSEGFVFCFFTCGCLMTSR